METAETLQTEIRHGAITFNGHNYASPDELRTLWTDHYIKLLNESPGDGDFDGSFKQYVEREVANMQLTFMKDHDDLGILSQAITTNEVASVCLSMPNNKASGEDNISYESLKYGGHQLYQTLCELFNAIITYTYIPAAMKHCVIVPLHKGKKKPRDDINSYRGISLNQVINKILEKIILTRMKPWFKGHNIPPPQQQSCKPGASSVTLSYVVHEVINSYRNENSKLFSCLVDIEKAFDSLWWSGLLYKMSKIGIKNKLWFFFREWLLNSTCNVMINGEVSPSFTISRSIKQGGLLSMIMFCISIYDIHTDVL